MVCSLLRYLHRFDDELDQIEIVNSIKGRSGQQHVSRKHAITMTLEMEKSEYNGPGLGRSQHHIYIQLTTLLSQSICHTA